MIDLSEALFSLASLLHLRPGFFAESAARFERHSGEQVTFLSDGGDLNIAPQITHFLSILTFRYKNHHVLVGDDLAVLVIAGASTLLVGALRHGDEVSRRIV